jgi:hypothetical protein
MIAKLGPNSVAQIGRGGFDLETEAALLKKWHAKEL